jgi:hypothetical protein
VSCRLGGLVGSRGAVSRRWLTSAGQAGLQEAVIVDAVPGQLDGDRPAPDGG